VLIWLLWGLKSLVLQDNFDSELDHSSRLLPQHMPVFSVDSNLPPQAQACVLIALKEEDSDNGCSRRILVFLEGETFAGPAGMESGTEGNSTSKRTC